MSGFIEGEGRNQATLFPERLDDYIAKENPVRVIDVLGFRDLGFKVNSEKTGQPAYHPVILLKIFIHGYLNRI